MRIFVSCTSQKHGEIKADISKIKGDSLEEIFKQWKIQTQGGLHSRDVYKGTQWNLIKQLNKTIPTNVISAGYGIINLDEPIVPYTITFSSAYPNNKHLLIPKFDLTQKEANKKWFNMFGGFDTKWDVDEVCIFTINPIYLGVLDLPKQDNIIILNNYKLGRLAKWLGTGANNLNVVFTQYLINNYPNITGNKELEVIVNDLDKKYGQDLYKSRKKVTDEFIKERIKLGGTIKKLRDEGYGCANQRFRNIKSSMK